MINFWQNLPKPIFCLAPMEEVTDFAFREMFAKYGKSDKSENRKSDFVMFTEFINVDGLTHPEGRKKLAIDLKYSEIQRPIVAQIWGNSPAKFEEAAKIIVDLGFDGIDINMGCPQDKEIGIGACAALIREPKLAQEIISATKKAAGFLPVSVKTRLGYSKADEMGDWVRNLLEINIAALTLHARTKQEKSKVPAHWEDIKEAVGIRNEVGSQTLIIGNGDIKSRQEGLERVAQTGCDGVMIGRGAFGNPWLFLADDYHPDLKERFRVMLEHAKLFQDTLGEHKSFFIMRKQFKTYCSGFNGAHELRAKLLNAKDLEEAEEIVKGYLNVKGAL
jgi:nifR3 family TIM-barrel protein